MKRRGVLGAILALLSSPVLAKIPVLRDIVYVLPEDWGLRSTKYFFPEFTYDDDVYEDRTEILRDLAERQQ